MPIKSLTNRQPQFPEIGQLRKGAEKPQKGIGRDLDHFRFTSDIEEVQAAFEERYNSKPRLINCFLPFTYVDDNWQAWNEHWVAGGLKHRCDGEYVVLQQNSDGKYEEPDAGTVPCPGGCSPSGRLKIIIPELKRLAYVTVLTSSVNDIINLDAQLRALQSVSADLRGVPLQLRRRKKSISTPGANGKRARRDSWLLSIEAAPSWVELQLAAQEAAAVPQLPEPDAPALPDGAVIVNGHTGEVLSGDTAQDTGPDWDDVPDQDEEDDFDEPADEDFEPPPDYLLVEIPQGEHAGKTMNQLLAEDRKYVELVAEKARNKDIRECARKALEWYEQAGHALGQQEMELPY